MLLRLAFIQLVEGPGYSCSAFRQQAAALSLEECPRGSILDRTGVSLTGERFTKRVAVFTELLKDTDSAARHLAAVLNAPEQRIKEMIEGKTNLLPFPLSEEQATAVKRAGWPGIAVVPVKERYGPRPLAVHVVGYLGKIDSPSEWRRLNKGIKRYNFGDYVGKAGLEYYYEHLLKGTVPCSMAGSYRDAQGRTLNGLGLEIRKQADASRADVVSTLDARLQTVVEDVMDLHVPCGAVVVLKAGTGDILAVGSRPAFIPVSPGVIKRSVQGEVFLDRAFSPYPPGSVFKIAVAAAALEEGIVTPRTKYYCRGASDTLVPCWNREGHKEVDFAQAFASSCNPTFARVGLKLGKKRLVEYCKAFRLADRSVVGYPLPSDSRQDPATYLKPYNLVNISVGQGPLLVTPVQVAALVNTMVNDGVYVRPRLVKGFRRQAEVTELPQDGGKRVISAETARVVREMMALSTAGGTGSKGFLEGYGSAGKTGTAEVDGERTYAWFAGYAPLDRPRYVIVVMVEGGRSGAGDAAPVFKEIAERILSLENTTSSFNAEQLK
ncbi:MAG: penicillin-binding transpeptidase domain-containing protein [Bacillota bacterium]